MGSEIIVSSGAKEGEKVLLPTSSIIMKVGWPHRAPGRVSGALGPQTTLLRAAVPSPAGQKYAEQTAVGPQLGLENVYVCRAPR